MIANSSLRLSFGHAEADLPNGPGYVKTMFAGFQNSLSSFWNQTQAIQIMANTHAGPPGNTDLGYANTEASIFADSYVPGGGYANSSGFGVESLSEYDVFSYPIGRTCSDNWCDNFVAFNGNSDLNLYLQTETPNLYATYAIKDVIQNGQYSGNEVECKTSCTTTSGQNSPDNPAAAPMEIYSGQGFALLGNSSESSSQVYQVLGSTRFACSSLAQCPTSGTETLYSGDFLPDTIPFAASLGTKTIEVYFCDWEYAFNGNSSTTYNNCQPYDSTYSPLYKKVLNTP